MRTIKEIIKDINTLEKDFDIFNKRILEFSKSTNSSSIDTDLLKKYISWLNNYINLLDWYKREINEIIDNDSLEEYQATKDLMIVRINNLKKILINNIKKLKLILKSVDFKIKSKNIEVDFSSKDDVIEINKNLYDFYNFYNINLDYQTKYNIKLSLDNNFENKIERELNSLELTKKEKDYLENINSIFEDIEDLKDSFNNILNNLINIEEDFFEKWTIQKSLKNFFQQKIKKNLKKSYEFKNFDVFKSNFFNDFSSLKKEIDFLIKKLNIILGLDFILKNKQAFLELDNKYNIFNNQDFIVNIFKISKNINEKYNNLDNFYKNISWIIWIENELDLVENLGINLNTFKKALEFLKKFDDIYENKSNDLIFWLLSNLFSMFSSDSKGENYIRYWLNNLKKILINEFNRLDLENKEYTLLSYTKTLKKIETNINFISQKIKSVSYSPWITQKSYKNIVVRYLDDLEKLFGFTKKSKYYISIKSYLFAEIRSRYNSSKEYYYSSSNSSSYSSYSWWSSWSSDSSSFSSSYSSSWSSSW